MVQKCGRKNITKLKTLQKEESFTTHKYSMYTYLQHKAKSSNLIGMFEINPLVLAATLMCINKIQKEIHRSAHNCNLLMKKINTNTL
jgi:hypothetical protein